MITKITPGCDSAPPNSRYHNSLVALLFCGDVRRPRCAFSDRSTVEGALTVLDLASLGYAHHTPFLRALTLDNLQQKELLVHDSGFWTKRRQGKALILLERMYQSCTTLPFLAQRRKMLWIASEGGIQTHKLPLPTGRVPATIRPDRTRSVPRIRQTECGDKTLVTCVHFELLRSNCANSLEVLLYDVVSRLKCLRASEYPPSTLGRVRDRRYHHVRWPTRPPTHPRLDQLHSALPGGSGTLTGSNPFEYHA